MANHFNFYTSLNLSQSEPPNVLHQQIQDRLATLQRQGAPLESAEVQQLLVADQILGQPEKRGKYDARLNDDSAPSMGVSDLRALAGTSGFPDEADDGTPAPAESPAGRGDGPAEETATSVMPSARPNTGENESRPAAPSQPTPNFFPPAPGAASAAEVPSSHPQPSSATSRPSSPQATGPQSGPQPQYGQPFPSFGSYPGQSAQTPGDSQPAPSNPGIPGAPGATPAHVGQAGPGMPGAPAAPAAKPLPGPLAPVSAAPGTAKALVWTLLGIAVVGVLGLLGALVTGLGALSSSGTEEAEAMQFLLGDEINDLIKIFSWVIVIPAAVAFSVITLSAVSAFDRVVRVPGSLSPISVTAVGAVIGLLSLTGALLSVHVMLTIALTLTTVAGIAVVVLAWLPGTRSWFTRETTT